MEQNTSQRLRALIQRELPLLHAFPEDRTTSRPSGTNTWSPQEELGHLIDSAANNHIRFVLASTEAEFHGPSYAQNAWVDIHGYQSMAWTAIIDFWSRYNLFLADLVDRIPTSKLQTNCYVGGGDAVTLQYLIDDYILHMQHHIDHLLHREHITPYPPLQPPQP